jgi:N-acetylglucosamine-6-phosphate deacetylase
MGAALGARQVWIEVILDQVHVSPSVMRWTRQLHGPSLCYISDCTPAAATSRGSWHSMGPLRVQLRQGAARLKGGSLAGGGLLLPDAFALWIQTEAQRQGIRAATLLRQELPSLWSEPLKALGLSTKQARLSKVEWQIDHTARVKCRIL